MRIPNPAIDSRFLSVTPILYPADNGHATGFFFNYDDETFLITNKHVLDRTSVNGNKLESIRIIIRPDKGRTSETESIDVDLREDGERLWYTHPSNDRIDIAVLPLRPPAVNEAVLASTIGEDNENETFALEVSHIPKPEEIVVGGRGLVIFGYPYRITAPYFPVARDALSASPYGYPFRNQPRFMTDAKTHDGLSGSPVLTQPSPMEVGSSGGYTIGSPRKAWYLVGVHSATLSTDIREPLDLNEAWYSTLLLDILEAVE